MELNIQHINLAAKIAKKCSTSKFRLGAVVVKKSRVISIGYNAMNKTHPIQKKFSSGDFSRGIHAEVHACIGVDEEDLRKSVLYVARIKKDGSISMSKPCLDCQNFLSVVGINKVHYTTDFNNIETLEL